MTQENLSKLFTPKQLGDRHAWLNMGGLRKYLFNREYNGLNKTGAVIAITSRKLLIDEEKFLEWVRSHTDTKSTPTKLL